MNCRQPQWSRRDALGRRGIERNPHDMPMWRLCSQLMRTPLIQLCAHAVQTPQAHKTYSLIRVRIVPFLVPFSCRYCHRRVYTATRVHFFCVLTCARLQTLALANTYDVRRRARWGGDVVLWWGNRRAAALPFTRNARSHAHTRDGRHDALRGNGCGAAIAVHIYTFF